MIDVGLLKLLPEGASVIGVIIVVILFLKQQDKYNVLLQKITDDFHKHSHESQKSFENQVSALTKQFFDNQKLYQDQIKQLMNSQISISREVISTLQDVKSSVDTLSNRINLKESA